LICKINYPCSDDLFFRGNGSSLRFIRFVANGSDIEHLAHLGVFNKARLKVLEALSITSSFDETQDMVHTGNAFKKLTQDLLPNLNELIMEGEYIPSTIALALFDSATFARMKTLSLIGCSLALDEAVRLLQALPALYQFTHMVASIGVDYDGMTIVEIGQRLRASHNPLSSFLRHWSITNPTVLPERLVTTYALLLIDRCPNLRYITADRYVPETIQKVMAGINSKWLFADFKETISPAVVARPHNIGGQPAVRIDRTARHRAGPEAGPT
ncbi:hypothetical protein LPJ61_005074, partial [Coemansia biformis]